MREDFAEFLMKSGSSGTALHKHPCYKPSNMFSHTTYNDQSHDLDRRLIYSLFSLYSKYCDYGGRYGPFFDELNKT